MALEGHRLVGPAHPTSGECPLAMLLAVGRAWSTRLSAEELHLIQGTAERPAAARGPKLPKPDAFGSVGLHRMPLHRGPSWMRQLKVSGSDWLDLILCWQRSFYRPAPFWSWASPHEALPPRAEPRSDPALSGGVLALTKREGTGPEWSGAGPVHEAVSEGVDLRQHLRLRLHRKRPL